MALLESIKKIYKKVDTALGGYLPGGQSPSQVKTSQPVSTPSKPPVSTTPQYNPLVVQPKTKEAAQVFNLPTAPTGPAIPKQLQSSKSTASSRPAGQPAPQVTQPVIQPTTTPTQPVQSVSTVQQPISTQTGQTQRPVNPFNDPNATFIDKYKALIGQAPKQQTSFDPEAPFGRFPDGTPLTQDQSGGAAVVTGEDLAAARGLFGLGKTLVSNIGKGLFSGGTQVAERELVKQTAKQVTAREAAKPTVRAFSQLESTGAQAELGQLGTEATKVSRLGQAYNWGKGTIGAIVAFKFIFDEDASVNMINNIADSHKAEQELRNAGLSAEADIIKQARISLKDDLESRSLSDIPIVGGLFGDTKNTKLLNLKEAVGKADAASQAQAAANAKQLSNIQGLLETNPTVVTDDVLREAILKNPTDRILTAEWESRLQEKQTVLDTQKEQMEQAKLDQLAIDTFDFSFDQILNDTRIRVEAARNPNGYFGQLLKDAQDQRDREIAQVLALQKEQRQREQQQADLEEQRRFEAQRLQEQRAFEARQSFLTETESSGTSNLVFGLLRGPGEQVPVNKGTPEFESYQLLAPPDKLAYLLYGITYSQLSPEQRQVIDQVNL